MLKDQIQDLTDSLLKILFTMLVLSIRIVTVRCVTSSAVLLKYIDRVAFKPVATDITIAAGKRRSNGKTGLSGQ